MGSAERALRRKQEQKLEKQTRPQDKALEGFLNTIFHFVFMGVPREKALKLFEAAWNDAEKAKRETPDVRLMAEVDRIRSSTPWWEND